MNSFKTPYQEFIYKRTYSRWLDQEQRREDWDETVERYIQFFKPKVPHHLLDDYIDACMAIRNLEVMPSMRCLWTAGEALDRENIAGYNCAYTTIDKIKRFADILYILMNGTGVGFSTERQYINQLPEVVVDWAISDEPLIFEDSKEGWADGLISFYKDYI